MAQRSPLGVYVRDTWDWLRLGNGYASCVLSGSPTLPSTILLNTSTGGVNIDLYALYIETVPAVGPLIQVGSTQSLTTGGFLQQDVFPLDPTAPPVPVQWNTSTNVQLVDHTLNWGNQALSPFTFLGSASRPFYRLMPLKALLISFPLATAATKWLIDVMYQVISPSSAAPNA